MNHGPSEQAQLVRLTMRPCAQVGGSTPPIYAGAYNAPNDLAVWRLTP
jgi:hypothetical protein